ncbi:sensor histidine kinase [Streptomyces violaceorubidus]|uniref:sensor histidine kinase n=1 Tax=Streptomyces violaceorubidus TaxID=284042 RepID=UPI00068E3F23|nr:histidine kinase [Streptomyces violaceorubidus]
MRDSADAALPDSTTDRYRDALKRLGRHRVVRGTALWTVLTVPVLFESPAVWDAGPVWWPWAGALLLVPAVVLRERRLPLSWGLSAVLSLFSPWFAPAMLVMTYLAGRRDLKGRPVEVVAAASAVLAALAALGAKSGYTTTLLNSAPLLVGAVTAWLAGRHRQQRRELELAGWQRARHLEREQQLSADRARIRERARIAQDMHDHLGHDLTLLAMQAAALEVAPALDESTRSTARQLRSSAGAAVKSLSDIIGVLRVDDDAPESSGPREDVTATVDRARAAGMLVDVRRVGLDLEAPPVIEEAVQRVVQEALTNAAKHAPGAEVQVRLERLTDLTVVTVTNGASGQPARSGGGHSMGLVGLAERARVLGGTFSAHHRDDGFEVSARLPHTGVRPGTSPPDDSPPFEAPATHAAQHHAEQRVRRSLAVVLAVPVVAVAAAVAVSVVYLSRQVDDMTLNTETYRGLRLGQSWEDLRSVLPSQQVYEGSGPSTSARVPTPPNSLCKYYRAEGGGFFAMEAKIYRLCFVEGQLASKDTLDDT